MHLLGTDARLLLVLKWTVRTVIGALLLIPVVLVFHAGLYDSFVDNVLSGWGMWGTFIIHLSSRPKRGEVTVTVVFGLVLRLAYDLAIGEKGYPGSALIGMGVFLGLASLVVLLIRAVGAPNDRSPMVRRALAVIAIFNYIGVSLSLYISFARWARPVKLDYLLYTFDGSLGFQPAFKLAQLVRASATMTWIEVMIYNSFGLWFCLIYAAHARYNGKFPFDILRLFVSNAFIGFSLFFVFPAMGPKYAFPTFPELPLAVHPAPVVMDGFPNAIPSLHFGGALLIFWMARPWKWLRIATGTFLVLTAVATMALGEHYLVDLVVAVPYALAILAFSAKVPDRNLPLISGGAMVASWLGILYAGGTPRFAAWLLIVATIALSYFLERRLAAKLWLTQPAESSVDQPSPMVPLPG